MGVDLCYIVSHGFAARMLLQTNLIQRLSKRGLTIAVVSPDATDENLAELKTDPNVQLVEWKTKSTLWDDDYLYKRMYYLEDLSKNPALREKFHNSLFFSKSIHPWKRVRPLYYFFIYQLIKLFPFIRSRFLQKESKHLRSTEADSILEELQPRLVVSTYPVSIIEAKMVASAKAKNIPTLQQLLSWDNITCKGQFPAVADQFIVWGDIMFEELQEYYGIESEKITRCGVPHFDEHIAARKAAFQSQALTDLGISPDQPYLFVAMSSPRFAPREIDIVEWLAKGIEQNLFGANMQLVVRPHPQNVQTYMAKASWLTRLDALKSKRVAVDYPRLSESNIRWSMKKQDMRMLSNLIAGCTICLNSGSTVSIDALMHNKPVILTSFDGLARIPYWNSARRLIDYTHLKKYVAEGGAVPVHSYSELEQVIRQYIQAPNHDLEKRRNALLRECFQDDGQSTERVVETLTQTLQQQR